MKRAFGVFVFTLGLCTAFACGFGIMYYLMEIAIPELILCIIGTAAGAATTSLGSSIIDF